MNRTLTRSLTTAGATAAGIALLTGTALAHHCYVPTGSTNAPASSNWAHIAIADGAVMFGMVDPACADVEPGNAALRAGGYPLSIQFFEKQTIGSNAPQRVLSDGKGLEQMGAGSTLADEALAVYVAAADDGCAPA